MISIKSNVKQFQTVVKKQQKQVNFACSKAINVTFKGARPYLIRHIKRRQKGKKAWWNSKLYGINRTFATKKKVVGSIYTRMYWALLQEHGGIKTPHSGKKLSIPTRSTPKSRQRAGGARTMLNQKKTFIATMPGGFKSGIWRRKTKKRLPIELLYSLNDRAVIDKPYLHFKETVEKYARRNFKKNLDKAVVHAFNTAK